MLPEEYIALDNRRRRRRDRLAILVAVGFTLVLGARLALKLGLLPSLLGVVTLVAGLLLVAFVLVYGPIMAFRDSLKELGSRDP